MEPFDVTYGYAMLAAVLLYQPFKCLQRLNTRLTPQNLALFKQYHGRYAPNLVFIGSRLCFVNIYFNHADSVANAVGELFENGCLLFAGAAPVGVEIDQHRRFAVDQVVEGSFHSSYCSTFTGSFMMVWPILSRLVRR